jgi:hypothetical protein
MGPEDFVTHLLDEGGLVKFVDVQFRGIEQPGEEDWREVARRVAHLAQSKCPKCGTAMPHTWRPSPEYLQDLYQMQRARLVDGVRTT